MGSGHSNRVTHFQRPSQEACVENIAEEDYDEQNHINITNKMVERLVEDATLAGGAAHTPKPSPRGDYRDKIFMEKLKCMDDSHSERSGNACFDLVENQRWALEANEQKYCLMVRDYRRPWTPATPEESQLRCRPHSLNETALALFHASLLMTVDDLHALANRIELRTANMVSVEPVCADCKKKVIDCYNSNDSIADTVKCWDTVGEFSKCVSDAAASRLRARTQKEARENARRSRHVAHAREHALRDLASTSVLD